MIFSLSLSLCSSLCTFTGSCGAWFTLKTLAMAGFAPTSTCPSHEVPAFTFDLKNRQCLFHAFPRQFAVFVRPRRKPKAKPRQCDPSPNLGKCQHKRRNGLNVWAGKGQSATSARLGMCLSPNHQSPNPRPIACKLHDRDLKDRCDWLFFYFFYFCRDESAGSAGSESAHVNGDDICATIQTIVAIREQEPDPKRKRASDQPRAKVSSTPDLRLMKAKERSEGHFLNF
jgi:hypothetical protein